MLIDHIGLAISNYDRSKAFYSQCLAAPGVQYYPDRVWNRSFDCFA